MKTAQFTWHIVYLFIDMVEMKEDKGEAANYKIAVYKREFQSISEAKSFLFPFFSILKSLKKKNGKFVLLIFFFV